MMIYKIKSLIDAIMHSASTRENLKKLEAEVIMMNEYICGLKRCVSFSTLGGVPTKLNNAYSIDESYASLRKIAPKAFEIYVNLYKNNVKAYERLPIDSCSVDGHYGAKKFGEYIKSFLHGYVLDIGCGPQAIPLYLKGYDYNKIYGIDPMEANDVHPYNFEQAISEYLPFIDSSFNCVIFATSLDHVFLIDKSLEEAKRVLINKGFAIFWMSFDEAAPRYDPFSTNFHPYDSFHMFHFTQKGFEDKVGEYFKLEDHFKANMGNHFYVYRKE